MKAIILAAGRGERMRPLTDTIPKPLLEVGGKSLIAWHVEKLAAAGIAEIVVNHAHLGASLEISLGDGARFGVTIAYSHELQALEAAGGIANALPLLGSAPFAAVNADVFSDYDYAQFARAGERLAMDGTIAHLVLVDNPAHHPAGDFGLRDPRVVLDVPRLTFSGLAVYRHEMFAGIPRGTKAPLAPLLREQILAQRVSGEHYRGRWSDVGTPERLAALSRELSAG